MRLRRFIFACGMVLSLQTTANAAPADACKSILEQFKSAADRANREVAATLANLQQAASQVPNDKKRIALIAQSCAAAAEAAGVLLSHRIVAAECMGNTEARSDFLNALDRSISQIRAKLSQACR